MNPLQPSPMQPGSALGAPAPTPQPPPANPLAPQPQAPAPDIHAAIGQHIAGLGLSPEDMAKEVNLASYGSEAFARLAKDPNIKPKDVIKVASEAVADKILTAEKAIALLSSMPTDQTKLHAWVKNLALSTMTTAVHVKAQMIQSGLAVATPPPAPTAAPGVPQ